MHRPDNAERDSFAAVARHTAPSPATSGLHLFLLGGFALYRDGNLVDTAPGPERVVAFLALQPRSMHRSYIAGHLWGNIAEQRSRHRLRTALWQLRAIDDGLVVSDRTRVGLRSPIPVDVDELQRQALDLEQGNRNAVDCDPELFRHDLLPGWYEEWVLTEQAEVRQVRLEALERLADANLSSGDYGRAVRVALVAAGGDPLRESAHRLVIRAHIAQGNNAAALRYFNWYHALIRDQFGIAPAPETQQLADEILGAR